MMCVTNALLKHPRFRYRSNENEVREKLDLIYSNKFLPFKKKIDDETDEKIKKKEEEVAPVSEEEVGSGWENLDLDDLDI